MRNGTATARHLESPDIQAMLAHALRDHRAGRLIEAERIYQQILAIDAQQSDSLHLLGMVAFQAGRHDAAVAMIREAISINGTQAAYHSNLGTVLQASGKLEEAVACYEQALALQPDLAEVHTNLGNIFQALDKLDDAAASHEQALALNPQLPEAHYNLGLAQLLKGNFSSGWPNLEWPWHTKDHETPMRNASWRNRSGPAKNCRRAVCCSGANRAWATKSCLQGLYRR